MARANLPDGPRLRHALHALSFLQDPRQFYGWLRRRYGDVVTVPGASAPLVMALTAEGARQVLTQDPDEYDAFHKAGFTGLAGAGSLWVLEGQHHRRERKLLSPAFHARSIRVYGDIVRDVARQRTDTWQAGHEIRAYDAMLDISRDVVLRTVLGLREATLFDDGRKVLKSALQAVHPLIAFVSALQAPWFPPWVRFQRVRQELMIFLRRCLAERRASGVEAQDVLGLLLAARCEDGTAMRDEEICDELFTILMSGHETTAVALSWALYELARHPAVLQRLRDELDTLGPDPDPDVLVKQPYLGAVCDETLRLHTVLTEIARITRRPCQLLGRALPAGVGIGVGIGAIHQDPSLYPEPDAFRPERFMEHVYNAFEFLPFGGGHRRCLGAAFADHELRIALAAIVSQWDLEIAGREKEIRHNLGTGPKYGVRMRVTGRRRVSQMRATTYASA